MVRSSILQVHRPDAERELDTAKISPALTTEDIMGSLINAVNGMTNVVELHFEWRDLPLTTDTRTLLSSTRTAFNKSLRKLVLGAQILKFKEVLAIHNFDNIDELEFHFDDRSNRTDGNTDVQELVNTVIPFISQCQFSLRSLVISSFANIDHTGFFDALPAELLHCLRKFHVQMPFDEDIISNPSGILRLLKCCSVSLRDVSLIFHPPHHFQLVQGLPYLYNYKRLRWDRINKGLLSRSNLVSDSTHSTFRLSRSVQPHL